MNSWDEKFIELAHFISKWSKDTSRGVVDNRNRIVSVGSTGVNDDIKDHRNINIQNMRIYNSNRL